jgi:membrane protease YdiL (CAAX protease family)
MKGSWSDKSLAYRLLGIFILCVAGLLLSGLLGTVLAMFIFNIDLLSATGFNLVDPTLEEVKAMKLIQLISGIGAFIVPAVLYGRLVGNPRSELALDKGLSFGSGFLLFIIMFTAIPWINAVMYLMSELQLPQWLEWLRQSEESNMLIQEHFLRMDNFSGLLYNLILMAFIPAIGEELIFRGILYPIFRDMSGSIHHGVWISALLFGVLHQQFTAMPALVLIGVMLGYMRAWSGSLWWPVFAHWTNNALILFFTYIFTKMGWDDELMTTIGTEQQHWFLVALSLFFTVSGLYIIYRQTKNPA